MKTSTLLRYTLILGLLAVGLTACDSLDSRLQEINTDPTQETSLDPEFQLTGIQLKAAAGRFESWRNNLIYNSTMIQHFATLAGYWAGDKYTYIASYSSAAWNEWYPSTVKEVVDLKRRTNPEENPAMVNQNAVARILRVLVFHRLTDLYGDIPYSEAGLAFYEGVSKPKYDQQQNIYDDMLNELAAARDQFDTSQPMYGAGDIMYTGNIQQWKKFANSLMLRLALRMVKVNPQKAQTWAQNAINGDGGLMESNDDIAYVPQQNVSASFSLNQNGNGEVFSAVPPAPPYLSKTFVDWMTSLDDPRLRVYGEESGPAVGLPNGHDDAGQNPIQEHESWVSCDSGADPCGLDVYMLPNEAILGRGDPMFFQTYAEVELMQAEALVRWGIGSGSAEDHYRQGVRAALNYLSMYGSEADISQSEVDAYVSNVPWGPSDEDRIRQINEQYWAATLMNEYESYANWRRTGYPELTPTNYPGNETEGRIPRRMIYPNSEAAVNEENYNEAIGRYSQGDDFMSRMWWDVEQ